MYTVSCYIFSTNWYCLSGMSENQQQLKEGTLLLQLPLKEKNTEANGNIQD